MASLLLSLALPAQVREKGGAGHDPSVVANDKGKKTERRESGITFYTYDRLFKYADAALLYARSYGYDTRYALFINMGMLSGTKRFFIMDLKGKCVVNSGLVAHGSGDEPFTYDRKYSNEPGSKCTSLGRYAVGSSYKGFFGLSFHLKGLDPTNSRASERNVVLHAMHCIPDQETTVPICQSEGCPAVSDRMIQVVRDLVGSRKKPLLLWVFDSNLPLGK
jgi:hypothetical protein